MGTGHVWPQDWEAEIPERFRGLIFDCDGTVVDTMPVHYQAWCKALQQVGIKFPEDRFYSFAGAPTVTIIQTLAREQNIACDPEAVAHNKEHIYVESMGELEPIHSVGGDRPWPGAWEAQAGHRQRRLEARGEGKPDGDRCGRLV